MILVIFGSGVNCAVTLSSNPSSVLGPAKGVSDVMCNVALSLTGMIGLVVGVFWVGSWYAINTLVAFIVAHHAL